MKIKSVLFSFFFLLLVPWPVTFDILCGCLVLRRETLSALKMVPKKLDRLDFNIYSTITFSVFVTFHVFQFQRGFLFVFWIYTFYPDNKFQPANIFHSCEQEKKIFLYLWSNFQCYYSGSTVSSWFCLISEYNFDVFEH